MAAVASGERQVLAELRPAMIEDGPIVAAGFWPMAQASQLLPTPDGLTRAIVVGVNPFASESFWKQGAVEASSGAIVDVRCSPAGAVLRRVAGPSGVCPSAMTSPRRGAGRASRRGRCPFGLVGRGEIGESLGHSIEAEGKADRGLDV